MTFEELVEQNHKILVGWFTRRMTDPVMAEDLAQETYLSLWRNQHLTKEWRRSLLFKVAEDRLIDFLRRPSVNPLDPHEVGAYHVIVYGVNSKPINDYIDVAEAMWIMGLFSATIRNVMFLAADGFSINEISNHLGIPEGTVKSRLSWGRERARQTRTA
jgi:DNA-directed RNA polymerase specialized sigma24 family protein